MRPTFENSAFHRPVLRAPGVIGLAFFFLAAACGGGGNDGADSRDKPEIQILKIRLDVLRNYVHADRDYLQLPDAIRECERLSVDAKGTPYAAEVDALMNEAHEVQAKLASDALKRAAAAVQSKLEKQDFAGALEVIDTLDPAFSSHDAYRNLMGKREEIRAVLRYQLLAENILGNSGKLIEEGDFEKADGLLDAYGLFRGSENTSWARGIQERRAELDQAIASAGTQRSFWELKFGGKQEDLAKNFDFGEGENWTVEDGAMVGRNQGSQPTLAECGRDGWIDYQISFQFKIEKGSFEVFLRGEKQGGGRRFFPINVIFPGQDDGRWHTVRIQVKGIRAEWTRVDTSEISGQMMTNERGPFGLGVSPDSEVHFKDVRVKVTLKDETKEDLPDELGGGEGWGGTEGFGGDGDKKDDKDGEGKKDEDPGDGDEGQGKEGGKEDGKDDDYWGGWDGEDD